MLNNKILSGIPDSSEVRQTSGWVIQRCRPGPPFFLLFCSTTVGLFLQSQDRRLSYVLKNQGQHRVNLMWGPEKVKGWMVAAYLCPTHIPSSWHNQGMWLNFPLPAHAVLTWELCLAFQSVHGDRGGRVSHIHPPSSLKTSNVEAFYSSSFPSSISISHPRC